MPQKGTVAARELPLGASENGNWDPMLSKMEKQ